MNADALMIASLAAASLVFLLSMMFVERRRNLVWTGACAAVALLAVGLPLAAMVDALGSADPSPEAGDYQLVGWKNDEYAGLVYLYLGRDGGPEPYLITVPFDYDSALDLHEKAKIAGSRGELEVTVSRGEAGVPQMRAGFGE